MPTPPRYNTLPGIKANCFVDEAGCWLWRGPLDRDGYPRGGKKGERMHRRALTLSGVTIPPGYHTDHLCRVRRCCNPEHLEPVTPRENIMRGVNHVAFHHLKTACPQGHPLSGANLYQDARGWRGCKACRKAASERQQEKRRA